MGVATFVEFLNPLAFDVTYVDESKIVDRDGAGRLEFPSRSPWTPQARENSPLVPNRWTRWFPLSRA